MITKLGQDSEISLSPPSLTLTLIILFTTKGPDKEILFA